MNRSYRRRIRIRLLRPNSQAVEPRSRPIEGYLPHQAYATCFRYGLHAYCGFRAVRVGRWECQVRVYLHLSTRPASFPALPLQALTPTEHACVLLVNTGSGRRTPRPNWDRSIREKGSRWSIDASCGKSGATKRESGRSRGTCFPSTLPDLLGLSSNPDTLDHELQITKHKSQNLTCSSSSFPTLDSFFSLLYRRWQATTSPVKHQERRRTQKDHVGRPEDERRQSEATYEGGAYEAFGGEEE
jgi:hypothetical protein